MMEVLMRLLWNIIRISYLLTCPHVFREGMGIKDLTIHPQKLLICGCIDKIHNIDSDNLWISGTAPMFTAYQDRIEITSIGTLPPHQTKEGFYAGVSIPVNAKPTEIFVQLHISEKSGRGVPRIVGEYGENAFNFSDNAITVTIPYNRLDLGGTPPSHPQSYPPR